MSSPRTPPPPAEPWAPDTKPPPVAILGAGFSKAVHEAMPTVASLSEQVMAAFGYESGSGSPLDVFDGDLERWMSFLSLDQPWLSEAENLANRSRFMEAADIVRDIIEQAEAQARREPVPAWLTRLVWTWSEQRAHIFTFNYDTLVERATMGLPNVFTLGDIYGTSLEWRTPPGSNGGMFATLPPGRSSLRLYKLHGSTNWGFGGLHAPVNARIVLMSDALLWQSLAGDDTRPPRFSAMFDDLTTLIVPPTFSKGSYYGNLALQAQWRRGASILGRTTQVDVLGYSFPTGDLTTREWVATSLSESARMAFADRNGSVAHKVKDRIAGHRPSTLFTGDDAIADYVDDRCGDLIEWSIDAVDDSFRLTVLVNGHEHGLPGGFRFDRMEDAQLWIDTRIEAHAPNRLDAAGNGETGGSTYWHRWVVMPPEAPHVDLTHS